MINIYHFRSCPRGSDKTSSNDIWNHHSINIRLGKNINCPSHTYDKSMFRNLSGNLCCMFCVTSCSSFTTYVRFACQVKCEEGGHRTNVALLHVRSKITVTAATTTTRPRTEETMQHRHAASSLCHLAWDELWTQWFHRLVALKRVLSKTLFYFRHKFTAE